MGRASQANSDQNLFIISLTVAENFKHIPTTVVHRTLKLNSHLLQSQHGPAFFYRN